MEPFSLQALSQSIAATGPLFFLLGLGLVLMLLDAFKVKNVQHWLGGGGLLLSAGWVMTTAVPGSQVVFFGMLETGGYAPLVHAFLSLAGAFTLFFTTEYFNRHERPTSEIAALLVFGIIGMILMANANDLMITFIGLETMSMALYIFAAIFKTDSRSNEAGLKYFLLGSFASAFLLFGISLIYGMTGFTNLTAISGNLAAFEQYPAVFMAATGLLLIGYLFKVSAFPFHNWTPDVYTGTPSPLAGFMATAGKMTAFVSLGVIMSKFQLYESPKVITLLAVASLLTMVYGNVVATRQANVKRMLAYSSIAHSGYLLLGLCAIGTTGLSAVVFYLAVYTLMNLGAFAVVGMVENTEKDQESETWKGLSRRNPGLAAAMAVFLFSLAGIPPLAGFMGKYQVFMAAIEGGYVWLAVAGILTSVVGAYYYLRLIFLMYFSKEGSDEPVRISGLPVAGAALLALLVLALGIFPFMLLEPISEGFAGLMAGIRGMAAN